MGGCSWPFHVVEKRDNNMRRDILSKFMSKKEGEEPKRTEEDIPIKG